jgi:ligand-binding SRPBCC domain-containing protein
MRVYVESVLPCPPEKVWHELQRPALLCELSRPLVSFVPADGAPFPERWLEGDTWHLKVSLFGILPLGSHNISVERIDPGARTIQTRESGPRVRRWDHQLRVRASGDGRTVYSDEIIIEAGWLTGLVWLYAQALYRHRQRRWRHVARRLATEPTATDDPGQVNGSGGS